MQSWINGLPEVLKKDNVEVIESMFEWLVDPCLEFIRKHCKVNDRCPIGIFSPDGAYPDDHKSIKCT